MAARRLDALQALLSSLRRADGRWSDGSRVVEGADLARLKRRVINQIVNMRAGIRSQRRDMTWHNFGALARISRKRFRHADETRDWLTGMTLRAAHMRDPGSTDRLPLLRRILRKHYPEAFRELPFNVRHTPMEAEFIERSWQGHSGVTRMPFVVNGIRVGEGVWGVKCREDMYLVEGKRSDGEIVEVLVRDDMMQRRRRARPAPINEEVDSPPTPA